MRIISGKFRGKKLFTLPGLLTRPTSDRAKESIFNILQKYVKLQDCIVCDVFAGSGALGIEALSRGAKKCIFVEKNNDAKRIIKNNINAIAMSENAQIIGDYEGLSKYKREAFDLFFIDPPYNNGLVEKTLNLLLNSELLKETTTIVVECENSENIVIPSELEVAETRIYGKAKILFLRK